MDKARIRYNVNKFEEELLKAPRKYKTFWRKQIQWNKDRLIPTMEEQREKIKNRILNRIT